jgi:hypothetical protein
VKKNKDSGEADEDACSLAGEEPARNGGADAMREVELLSGSSEARTERLS